MRRCKRKKYERVVRDLCIGWRPPMKLRKIRPTADTIERCGELFAAYFDAGRARLVARSRVIDRLEQLDAPTPFDLLAEVKRYIESATPEDINRDVEAAEFDAYDGIGERLT